MDTELCRVKPLSLTIDGERVNNGLNITGVSLASEDHLGLSVRAPNQMMCP